MAGFLYYIPGQARVTAEQLEEIGLGPVFGGNTQLSQRGTAAGPDGCQGVVAWVGDAHAPKQPGYFSETQTWGECASGQFWLGYVNAEPPTPRDLVRLEQVPGYLLALGDGHEWMIPVARVSAGDMQTMLPQIMRLDNNGGRVYETPAKYDGLVEYAARTFEALQSGSELGDGFKWDACVEALGTNYRVTGWEVSALKLLTVQLANLVLLGLCDWISFAKVREAQAEAAKKNGLASIPDTSSTSAGSMDSQPATSPPTPTSRCSPVNGGK